MTRSSVFIELLLPTSVRRSWEEGIKAGGEATCISEIAICLQCGLHHTALHYTIRNIARGDAENTQLYAKAIESMQAKHSDAPSAILDILDTHAAGTHSYRVLSDIREMLELPRQPTPSHSPKPQEPKL